MFDLNDKVNDTINDMKGIFNTSDNKSDLSSDDCKRIQYNNDCVVRAVLRCRTSAVYIADYTPDARHRQKRLLYIRVVYPRYRIYMVYLSCYPPGHCCCRKLKNN